MSSIVFPLLLSYYILNSTVTINTNLKNTIYDPINYDSYEIICKNSLTDYVLNYNDLYEEYGNQSKDEEVEIEIEVEVQVEEEVEVDLVEEEAEEEIEAEEEV
jgi:hypothetical protein